ncbi:MAG TPA: GNAT family N-acetyltransferase [Anaerolineaceae bacterium]|nr:GNAT family N-acetyltransferase [Anaerolineaceae bacterium]
MKFRLVEEFPTELKESWNLLLDESSSHVPFLRFEYLQEWWDTRGGGEWPQDSRLAILVAEEDGELTGIAPLFIPGGEEPSRLMLLGSVEISDFLDVICCPENLERFCAELLAYVKENQIRLGDVRSLDLYNLLDSSPSLATLATAAQQLELDCSESVLQHCPYIPLPGNWETYLEGIDKKQRHEIRRKMRRAAEDEVAAEFYITSDPARLEEDIEDFLSLMEQDTDKACFLTANMRDHMKRTMRCSFENGCLQLAFLIIGGKKAAGYFSFDYLDRIWVYNSGLDREYMPYSPGWVLLGHMLQWANENGKVEFDFMRGDEDYKYKFGAVDRMVKRITIGI